MQRTGRSYKQQIPVVASLVIAQGVLYPHLTLMIFGYAVLFSQTENFVDEAKAARMQEEFPEMPGGASLLSSCSSWSAFRFLHLPSCVLWPLLVDSNWWIQISFPHLPHGDTVPRPRRVIDMLLRTNGNWAGHLWTDHLFQSDCQQSF